MAFDFSTLITDRTKADVDNGTEKGFYNYEDLNRVETATAETAVILNENGHPTTLQPQKTWVKEDFWTETEITRYLDNVKYCKNQLGIPDDFFGLPETMDGLTWQGANAIEKSLEKTVEFVTKIEEQQIYAGTFNAGEEW